MRRPDGSPHVLIRHLPDPPLEHRRLDLPGRTEREDERPGTKSRRIIFQSVLDADERPLMVLELRSDQKLNPETVLLDPSSVPKTHRCRARVSPGGRRCPHSRDAPRPLRDAALVLALVQNRTSY